jgi:cysteine desulfurase / selenocysteine lyase
MRDEIVGVDELVPVSSGASLRYANLDNAATTPPMRAAVDTITRFMPMASSVHRGSGFKSRASTAAFDEARKVVGHFVGANLEHDVVVFTKNTTEAINTFARSMVLPEGSVVLTTVLEHHSNLLPWRLRSPVVHIRCAADGTLDEDDLDAVLARFGGRVALLAVTGASNVTGVTPPVHRLAEKVHAVGGRILVDAAQLAGHRPIDMLPHDHPGHLDAVAMSAHKMYAPFGSGALIADRRMFGTEPDHRGGGTVRAVTLDDIVWDDLPDRSEAGTPNLLGAIAFAAAAKRLGELGLDNIAAHEMELTRYARARLAMLPGVTVFGTSGPLGVIPLGVDGWDPRHVAAVLGYEHGVGVRAGCFCAHPYVAHLLGLDGDDVAGLVADARRGDMRAAPGLVRISLGCYNDRADIDRAVEGLGQIVAGEVGGSYRQELDGSFVLATSDATRRPMSVLLTESS